MKLNNNTKKFATLKNGVLCVEREQSPGECWMGRERERKTERGTVRSLLDKSHLTTGSSLSLFVLSHSRFGNSRSLSLSGTKQGKEERMVLKEE